MRALGALVWLAAWPGAAWAGDPSSAPEAAVEAVGALDELTALTVVSLGGSGFTRLTIHATPGATNELAMTLPAGARLWKAFLGERALDPARLGSGERVRVPLRGAAQVELAYTFELAPLGLRGRYRVELPRFEAPVRDAAWQLWLPDGLSYSETQASLGISDRCRSERTSARIPLSSQGQCQAFTRSVLAPGIAYVEGAYAQPLSLQ